MKKKPMLRLLSYLGQEKTHFFGSIFAAIVSVACFLLLPVLTGRAIDQMLGPGQVQFDAITRLLYQFLLAFLGASIFHWLMLSYTRVLSAKVAQNLRQEAFDRLQTMPLSVVDKHTQGDLVNRLVADADQVGESLNLAIASFLPGIVTLLVTILFMGMLHLWLALFIIIVTPLSVLPVRFLAKRTSKHFRGQNQTQGQVSAYVSEMLEHRVLVSALCYEEKSNEIFHKMTQDFFESNWKAVFYSSLSMPVTRFVNALIYLLVGVGGGLLALGGGLSIGSLSAFLAYANQYTRPFNEGSAQLTAIGLGQAALERIFYLIDQTPEEAPSSDPAKNIASETIRGEVCFRHVDFSYEPDGKTLEDICLHASPGSHIALVGATGSGKTTLVNLLMGFYTPDSGEILLDGQNIRELAGQDLHKVFGMVLQDSWIKHATVRENIAYGKPQASLEEVIEAAKQAMIHPFILSLPQGYDTVISNDSSLSAGQKQLLSIARVFLAKPQVLLLDEATSSIDTRTEVFIQTALRRLMEGHTSFIVAHRLKTIQSAHTILLMDQGKIKERGTHEELLQKKGLYARLYYSQFGKEME